MLYAQDKPQQPGATSPLPQDWVVEIREIRTADIRDIQFDSSATELRFRVAGTGYIFKGIRSTDSDADRLTIIGSLLAELRRSDKISFQVRAAELSKQIVLHGITFHFDSLK